MGDIYMGQPRGSTRKFRSIGANYYALGDDLSFGANGDAWRSDVEAQAGMLPVDFLMEWISVESGFNPCSYTSLQEAGIFQLMAGDNMAQGGTTMAQQHPVPPCVAGVQTSANRASLTDDQAYEQVRAGIQYVNFCKDKASALLNMYGYGDSGGWSFDHYSAWCMTKMVHVAPAVIPGMLHAGLAGAGGVPADWDDMVQYVTNVPASWLANARKVGAYGEGGGSIATAALSAISGDNKFLVLGALGVGLLYLLHKNR